MNDKPVMIERYAAYDCNECLCGGLPMPCSGIRHKLGFQTHERKTHERKTHEKKAGPMNPWGPMKKDTAI